MALVRVTILAFVCNPQAGTEAGIGWRWAKTYSEMGHEVTIISHVSQSQHFSEDMDLKGLEFVFLGSMGTVEPKAPTGIYQMIRMKLMYSKWLDDVRSYLQVGNFDFVQHVSWSTIRLRSPARFYSGLAVFGPLGGGQKASISKIPRRDKFYEFARNISVFMSLVWQKRFSRVENQPLVLVTNNETEYFAKQVGYKDVLLELADGIEIEWIRNSPRKISKNKINLLWGGRLVASKRPDLSLLVLHKLVEAGVNCHLNIAGDGNQLHRLQDSVRHLGLETRVHFLGRLSRDEMKILFDETDLVLFTSFRDSSSPIILEAASRGVPTIAIRNQGVKSLIPFEVAIGPDGNLEIGECVDQMYEAVMGYSKDGTSYIASSASCLAFAREQEWRVKAERVLGYVEARSEAI